MLWRQSIAQTTASEIAFYLRADDPPSGKALNIRAENNAAS